jgi:hypothetical protein
MCAFTPQGDFTAAMLRFVTAHAGLIEPQPGRVHFNLNARADCSSPCAPVSARTPVGGDGLASAAADRHFYSLDACFSMTPELNLPERIVELGK